MGKRGKAQGNAHPSCIIKLKDRERQRADMSRCGRDFLQIDSMNAGDGIRMKLFYCCFLYYNGGKCGRRRYDEYCSIDRGRP